jgi:hypothetical protein
MDEEQKVIYIICGSLALIVAGIIYYVWTRPKSSSVPVTLISTSSGSSSKPMEYYIDVPQSPAGSAPDVQIHSKNTDPAIVQNEETIKWTDWMGKDRVISISRKVH